ncbi:ATP-grasp domain-containing protein [Bryobacter aggregatus]|uniref:ATP-grasp domain-containing protein n=1 Tax=Bryobacter aggregatus TaxID=360054 RepID=UPI0004E0CCC1|nr:ATP-grasp domain-containing protein [Bryobacter aggregatus]
MPALTVLCIASYEKGYEFLREAKRQGCRVLLLTSHSLKDVAKWPMEAIDEIFYMPDEQKKWDQQQTINAVSYLAQTEKLDRIVPLDDFDLEMAAALREHLRIPGMGATTTRYFRDKLAMRRQAAEKGLNIPEFVHVLNHAEINAFIARVPGPWMLKPRLMAGAIGIRKVYSPDDLWNAINTLGDERSNYLLEKYIAGPIFHVDSIVSERKLLFAVASRYGRPPMDVSHEGGVFTTRLLEHGTPLEKSLLEQNAMVLGAMGLLRGVSHTEFIQGREDGKIYFLETSARVGGAHIADLIANSTGVNLWAEWAKIEVDGGAGSYSIGPVRNDYGGLLVSLARQEKPDTSAFNDPELVWRMEKKHHVGLIVVSPNYDRVQSLMDKYVERVREDFLAVAPPREKPSE